MKNHKERDLKNRLLDAIERIGSRLYPSVERIFRHLNPSNDYGIENLRMRGLVRLLLGVFSSLITFLVGGAIAAVGAVIHGQYFTCDLFIIPTFLGWVVPMFLTILVLGGLVELIFNREWDDVSRIIRIGTVIFVGIPIALVVLFSYLAYVSNLESLILGT